MPAKLTILLCALLMPGLAATQAKAQGFIVSKSETDVVEHGRNQAMGAIRLDYSRTGGNIDDGRTIKVSYGSLYLTGGAELLCAGTFNRTDTEETANTSCDSGVEAAIANHKDSGVGTVTITLGTARPDANQFAYVVLRGVRADVSASVFWKQDPGLHQFLDGPHRFRSHRSGENRKPGRQGVHRQERHKRSHRESQPAPVQPRHHNR